MMMMMMMMMMNHDALLAVLRSLSKKARASFIFVYSQCPWHSGGGGGGCGRDSILPLPGVSRWMSMIP